jgi:hypothetical protein
MCGGAAEGENLTHYSREDDSDPGIIILGSLDDDTFHRALQLLPSLPPLNIGYNVAAPVAGRHKMCICA